MSQSYKLHKKIKKLKELIVSTTNNEIYIQRLNRKLTDYPSLKRQNKQ